MDEGDGPGALARFCQELQRAADADRRRLARTLHDSASQTLSAAAMSLSLLEQEGGLSARGRRALADAQRLVDASCRELQELSQALYPPLLSEAGLAPALGALARRQGRLSLDLAALPRLPAALELGAYRFVEEALAMFAEGAPVQARVFHDRQGLGIALAGAAGPATTGIALQQRALGRGGLLREQRASDQLTLEVRFPPASADET